MFSSTDERALHEVWHSALHALSKEIYTAFRQAVCQTESRFIKVKQQCWTMRLRIRVPIARNTYILVYRSFIDAALRRIMVLISLI